MAWALVGMVQEILVAGLMAEEGEGDIMEEVAEDCILPVQTQSTHRRVQEYHTEWILLQVLLWML